jgi:8-oxo-dGTP pyrophosphatase MutT (NUDIX family)
MADGDPTVRTEPFDASTLDPGGEIEVWAAGGVVRRRTERGVEVLIVHRPKRKDWSLPKGKLDPGESLAEAAVREIREETGYECELGERLSPIRYRDAAGRSKAVVYFLATPTGGEFRANHEVDDVRWLTLPDAVELLTYPHDRVLVGRALIRVDLDPG